MRVIIKYPLSCFGSSFFVEINASLEKDSDQVKQIIYRYASAFAKRKFLEHEITDVQFMTSISNAIPYSKRDDLHFKVKEDNGVYGWKGVVKDVVELRDIFIN
ncbi:hypothetical protein [Paenibacillus kribbensis]|uniref:hypothetical protein n=1 Tax=Paenibacillus kribbensis TaxID=172713 RepID=UPI001FC9FA9A|nr:hypothetical protein [Paenibacillus kribbensis]